MKLRDILIAELQKPNAWTYDGYRLHHKRSKLSLWICSGRGFLTVGVTPNSRDADILGYFDKLAVWPHAIEVRDQILADLLQAGSK